MRTLSERLLSRRMLVTPGSPVVTSQYVSEVLADNPVAYYRLGDPAGATVADMVAPPIRDGVVTGSISFGVPGAIAGDPDTAVRGDTSGDNYIEFPVSLGYQTLGGLAVEFWIRNLTGSIPIRDLTNTGGTVILDAESDSIVVRLAGTNYNTSIDSGLFRSLTWRHYVVEYVHAGPTLNVYVDGVVEYTATITSRSGATNTAFRIFRNGTASAGHGGGDIDELAFYDHPLGAERVAAHYAEGSGA